MTLRIGDLAPDFEAATIDGRIRFHEWIENSRAALFSHPNDIRKGGTRPSRTCGSCRTPQADDARRSRPMFGSDSTRASRIKDGRLGVGAAR
jgi:hypothetical protein